ncbi:MAG: hypothetical protein D6711_19015 [Chloroflexi bacterium]|nr:MAG: hypothetical protein D6711_19015 [Chloroflexota bacterium]
MSRKLIAILSSIIICTLVFLTVNLSPISAQSGNYIVTSSNLQGWAFSTAPYDAPFFFAENYAATGSGSLEFGPIGSTGSNKFIMYPPFFNQPITNFNGISVQFLSSVSSLTDYFYFNVYIDLSVNGLGTFYGSFYDCRYDFVAPDNLATFTWHTFAINGSSTPDNVQDPNGSACAATYGGNAGNVLFIAINAGDTTTIDSGLTGAFDDVQIQTASGTITYDFELLDTTGIVSVGIPNLGLILINSSNPVPALIAPNAQQAIDSIGNPITLPADADSNGFDTYVITGCEESNNTIWASIWLGGVNYGFVDLNDSRITILTELPTICVN